jgi:hypothetical protein
MTTLRNIAAVWWVVLAQVAAQDTLLPLFEFAGPGGCPTVAGGERWGDGRGVRRPHVENETAVSLACAKDTAVEAAAKVPPRGVEPRFSD